MKEKATISQVLPDSIAEEAGLEPGDTLLQIDGTPIVDIFDYRFGLASGEEVTLLIEKKDGSLEELVLEDVDEEELGIVFERPLIDRPRACKNRCVFCFIDQLPKGMRKPVYFKDDDYRLSFLYGNYVTLTNMTEDDLNKVIRMRLSPINISVHTTNPDLRVKMLRNPTADQILPRMQKFFDAELPMNAQIVLCPDWNDKDELDRTLSDLSRFLPHLKSISVVPVGLTAYREKLAPLRPFTPDECHEVLVQVTRWQERFSDLCGSRVVYPADEFYIQCGGIPPACTAYEDFPQIENGVGMIASFRDEFQTALEEQPRPLRFKHCTVATGACAAPMLKSLITPLTDAVNVTVIPNRFFGGKVTVSGLLTGSDLIAELKGRDLGEAVYISENMLRSEGDLFLDDTAPETVANALGVPVIPVPNDGGALLHHLLEGGV